MMRAMWGAIEYRETLLAQGGNAEVRRAIWQVYSDYWKSVMPLVGKLDDRDIYETCYKIFCYVLDNVEYKEDPGNNQYVKTPARLIYDGVGDCKSMCIFICSCLSCLGIPCRMRFVSFDNREIYTHVYAVARDGREDIIIDPVERLDNMPIFNWARNCTYMEEYIC